MSDSLSPHELQHARPPCPSPTPGVHSDSRPSSQWCHPAISSSVVPFSFCPQPLPASKSFPMSQLFEWGGQSTGVSALASFLQFKFNIITDMSGHKVSTLQFVFYFFHLFIFLLAFLDFFWINGVCSVILVVFSSFSLLVIHSFSFRDYPRYFNIHP